MANFQIPFSMFWMSPKKELGNINLDIVKITKRKRVKSNSLDQCCVTLTDTLLVAKFADNFAVR